MEIAFAKCILLKTTQSSKKVLNISFGSFPSVCLVFRIKPNLWRSRFSISNKSKKKSVKYLPDTFGLCFYKNLYAYFDHNPRHVL